MLKIAICDGSYGDFLRFHWRKENLSTYCNGNCCDYIGLPHHFVYFSILQTLVNNVLLYFKAYFYLLNSYKHLHKMRNI